MFDNYTTPGKLYKKVVAGFIVVTVFATALFYSYLTKQSSHKSNASTGEFVTFTFNPPTTTVDPNDLTKTYQTTIVFDQSSHPLAVQGYNIPVTFDKTHLQITDIKYAIGSASASLADTNSNLAAVNAAGKINLYGEVDQQTPTVVDTGTWVASITYKVNSASPVVGVIPNFSTSVDVQGQMIELKSDNSLASVNINPASFTVQTSNYTPVPSGPVGQCGQFQDVPSGDPFYNYIQCLGCNNIVSGYQCDSAPTPVNPARQCVPPDNLPYYEEGNNMNRAEYVKLIALSAHFTDTIPSGQQTFADVPSGSTFWKYIEQAYLHQIISGYQCTPVTPNDPNPTEPCDSQNRPYFRPSADIRRDEAMKVVIAATPGTPLPPTTATFADVPVGSTFFTYVEEAYRRGIITGYNCTPVTPNDPNPTEPCDSQNRPYFRPTVTLTRGQAAKVAAVGFNCVLPSGSPNPSGSPAPAGNTTINMKLKFQGITAQPAVNKPLNVQVKIISHLANETFTQTVPFTSDASGIWSGTASITLDPAVPPQNNVFSIYVKGPMHLKKRVCVIKPTETAPGTYSCATDGIPLSIGTNTVNMSSIYMLTGDLPVTAGQPNGQNGLVDSEDTSYIRTHFGDKTPAALDIADLNLDGSIDTQDFSLVLAALGVKYDDPEEQ